MLLDQDNQIVSKNETDLKIYQKAFEYAEKQEQWSEFSDFSLVEIRFIQDLGLARPGFHSSGMKYKDITVGLHYSHKRSEATRFANDVLKKAQELEAIDIIIGNHYR